MNAAIIPYYNFLPWINKTASFSAPARLESDGSFYLEHEPLSRGIGGLISYWAAGAAAQLFNSTYRDCRVIMAPFN